MNNSVPTNLNPDKVNQFLEQHRLPKLIQGQTDHLNMSKSISTIESIINNLPKPTASVLDSLFGKLQQI